MVRRAGAVAQKYGAHEDWVELGFGPGDEPAAQCGNVACRERLLPDGLFECEVPLPGVWQTVPVRGGDCATLSNGLDLLTNEITAADRSEWLVCVFQNCGRMKTLSVKTTLAQVEKPATPQT